MKWVILKNVHSIAGLLTGVLGILLCFGGLSALLTRRSANMDWKTKRLLLVGKIHGFFGYFVVFGSQITLISGAFHFFNQHDKHTLGVVLVALNISLFVVMMVVGEVTYRLNLSREDAFNKVQTDMTIEQFE